MRGAAQIPSADSVPSFQQRLLEPVSGPLPRERRLAGQVVPIDRSPDAFILVAELQGCGSGILGLQCMRTRVGSAQRFNADFLVIVTPVVSWPSPLWGASGGARSGCSMSWPPKAHICVSSDSSVARGIANRAGAGKLKQLKDTQLWAQQLLGKGRASMGTVPRISNSANARVHACTAQVMEYHLVRVVAEVPPDSSVFGRGGDPIVVLSNCAFVAPLRRTTTCPDA